MLHLQVSAGYRIPTGSVFIIGEHECKLHIRPVKGSVRYKELECSVVEVFNQPEIALQNVGGTSLKVCICGDSNPPLSGFTPPYTLHQFSLTVVIVCEKVRV